MRVNTKTHNDREVERDLMFNMQNEQMQDFQMELNTRNASEEGCYHLLCMQDIMIQEMWFHLQNHDMQPCEPHLDQH